MRTPFIYDIRELVSAIEAEGGKLPVLASTPSAPPQQQPPRRTKGREACDGDTPRKRSNAAASQLSLDPQDD